MSTTTTHASPYLPVRDDWLARRTETILEPALPIVDPHHHLWERPSWRYMLEDLLADTNSGHNIVATVFVQCRSMHRSDGPEEFRPVGETEFVNGVAAMSASGGYGATKICAGIVGHVDRSAGGSYPRRWWTLPRHSSHHRLRCRSEPDEPRLQPAARPDGRQNVPGGVRLSRAIEFDL